jgi:predicted phosphoribosyltransferase
MRRGDPEPPFKDRADAGRKLGARLAGLLPSEPAPVVLALPRGGVPVGYEVARSLRAPLDVVVARKLGAPEQPELGVGAVALWEGSAGSVRVLHEHAGQVPGVTREYLRETAAREEAEARRRLGLYRGDRSPPELAGQNTVLVDDGLATGVTARAAILAVRGANPRRLVLAVPICARPTAAALRPEVDDLVCLHAPRDLYAVGLYYGDFGQTPDEEVVHLLEAARSFEDGGRAG